VTAVSLPSDDQRWGLTYRRATGEKPIRVTTAFVWTTSARDLAWRWRRFLITTVAAALVLALTILLSGIIEHLDAEIERTVDTLGADGFAFAADIPGPFTSVAAIPAEQEGALLAAGATRADPIVAVPQTLRMEPALDAFVIGHRPGGLGTPPVSEGRAPVSDGEAAVDSKSGLTLGADLVVAGATYEVVGLTEGLTVLGERPNVYITLAAAQRAVFGGQSVATTFLIEGEVANPPVGLRVIGPAAAIDDLRRPMVDTIESIELFRTLLWLVAAAIVGSVLYLSALERSRDMAVFKATGASSGDLVAGLALQSLVLSLSASALAVVVAFALKPLFPAGISLTMGLLLKVPVVAVVIGVLGSLAGLRRTLKADPAIAFGGP